MDEYSYEQLQNIRRMAERGLGFAQEEQHSGYVDMFQHILDLVESFVENYD